METEAVALAPDETALLLCDVWDGHWSRGAEERLEEMVPTMNRAVEAARDAGVTILHAPSGTMAFYEGTPARQRVLDAPAVEPPAPLERDDPPLPIDDSDRGSDTDEPGPTSPSRPWTRQHAGIGVDQARDGISAGLSPILREIEVVAIPDAKWGVQNQIVGTQALGNVDRTQVAALDQGTQFLVAADQRKARIGTVNADTGGEAAQRTGEPVGVRLPIAGQQVAVGEILEFHQPGGGFEPRTQGGQVICAGGNADTREMGHTYLTDRDTARKVRSSLSIGGWLPWQPPADRCDVSCRRRTARYGWSRGRRAAKASVRARCEDHSR